VTDHTPHTHPALLSAWELDGSIDESRALINSLPLDQQLQWLLRYEQAFPGLGGVLLQGRESAYGLMSEALYASGAFDNPTAKAEEEAMQRIANEFKDLLDDD
jgi:hypothetical protein